jgi:hypothetical protein
MTWTVETIYKALAPTMKKDERAPKHGERILSKFYDGNDYYAALHCLKHSKPKDVRVLLYKELGKMCLAIIEEKDGKKEKEHG